MREAQARSEPDDIIEVIRTVAKQAVRHFLVSDASLETSDLEQEVLGKLVRCIPKIAKALKPAALARTIARNHLIDTYRHAAQFVFSPVSRFGGEDDGSGEALEKLLNNPSQEFLQMERAMGAAEIVSCAVAQLPRDEAQVVRLHDWQEMSFAMIAESMNISETTARNLYWQACKRLEGPLERFRHVRRIWFGEKCGWDQQQGTLWT